MKLRSKGFIIIGSLWLAFVLINYFLPISQSLLNFSALGCLFAVTMGWLSYLFIIRRIEQLNKQLKEIRTKNSELRVIKMTGQDEVALIAEQINDLYFLHRSPDKQTEKQQATQGPLTWLKERDTQTSLTNRLFFNETLNKAMSHAKRHDTLLAVLLVDISPVKTIKQLLGSSATDEFAMQEMEKRLAAALRSEDILVKLEGHAFSILLNDIGKAKFASTVANKIIQATAAPINIENKDIYFTTHIGICIYPTEGSSLEDLLKNAEIALNKAKNAGINTFKFYTQAMDAEASEYIHMEKSLRKAISNNELALYYQPKVQLKTGSITRLEALIRWVHPEIGVINPEKFLPIAEETGLIHALGEWALREACKMNKQWQEAGYAHMPVAVNLSSKQFHH